MRLDSYNKLKQLRSNPLILLLSRFAEYYPMYIAGRTKKGNLVYYENMGKINMEKLQERGVTVQVRADDDFQL